MQHVNTITSPEAHLVAADELRVVDGEKAMRHLLQELPAEMQKHATLGLVRLLWLQPDHQTSYGMCAYKEERDVYMANIAQQCRAHAHMENIHECASMAATPKTRVRLLKMQGNVPSQENRVLSMMSTSGQIVCHGAHCVFLRRLRRASWSRASRLTSSCTLAARQSQSSAASGTKRCSGATL